MNSNYIIGEKEIAKKFNKYFSEVVKCEVLKRDPNLHLNFCQRRM